MFGFKIISKETLEIQTKIRNIQERMIEMSDDVIAEYRGLTDTYEDYISVLKLENIKLKQYIKELENGPHGDRVGTTAVDNCETCQSCNCKENSETGQNEPGI